MQRQGRPVVREVEVMDMPSPEQAALRTFELRLTSNAVVPGLTLEDITELLRFSR